MDYAECVNKSKTSVNLSDEKPECLRKIFIIKLFGVIGILVTLPLGLLSFINGNEVLIMRLKIKTTT